MRFTFTKEEKLKGKKIFVQLFEQGSILSQFPLRMVYLKISHKSNYPIQVAFSVPKRKFKNAIDRNRLKRLMRESYRKNKHILYENIDERYILMFIYTDEKHYKYVDIEKKMILLIKNFVRNIRKE